MYDYKARTYSPSLGRFLQTDPIGYGDGLNWYNYVRGDPINSIDPNGLDCYSLSNHDGYMSTEPDGTYTYHSQTYTQWCFNSTIGGAGTSINGGGGFGSDAPKPPPIKPQSVDRCANRATNNAIKNQFKIGGGTMRGQSRPFLDQLKDKYAIHADPFSGSFLTKSYWASHVDVWEVAGFVAMAAAKGAAPSGPNLRATFDVGRTIGYDRETNFGDTSYVTVIFGPEGPLDPNTGLPTRPLVSVYPGC